ncbi:PREDICTED: UPF0187 protein At3g61320, chloroplastic-like [Fragaria vesca subsp. vesca]|uniref:UPF0187 protein At3g61320, chloroplastic-like n=1 Tax=Fragaria vesca subsp. vesca TaxID=101020 RepID=UPI0002C34D27|nr:PREDICTED: UPF0187 protein At3g61320, chloroplastic-like [Fragaria vesca subsp. vesca]
MLTQPTNCIKPTSNILFSFNSIPKSFFKLHPPLNPRTLSLKHHCSQYPNPTPSSSSSSSPFQPLSSILRIIPDWADEIKERGFRQDRTLYDHEKWVHHRSSYRHLRHFLTSLSSRVILSLIPPVIAFTLVAVVIASYNTAVALEWLPEVFPMLRSSTLPYQLTAPALALLLVFRTEASYSRFEEGRKAWTKVIAGTNDFARQIISGVENSGDAELKKALLQYVVAFPVALKCHVIYGSNMGRDLQNLLEVDDLLVVLSSKHGPGCIIEFISQNIRMLKLEESRRNMLESNMSCFHEGISVCENLIGTPIPLSYTRLTSRFLVLWHLTLPIILWDDCHWIVVPATFISAASLFCIEEVGVLIEEPFPMLALDDLCRSVQENVQEALSREKLIQARLTAKGRIQKQQHCPNGQPKS